MFRLLDDNDLLMNILYLSHLMIVKWT